MNIPHQTYKIDINNINEPHTRAIESVLDNGVRFVDVELWADSTQITLPNGCTATAVFVTDGTLINDSVACEISSDLTTVTVPIDNSAIESKSGLMSVQVEIKDVDNNVLALPYAFKVRVKKTILSDAKVTEKSIGTVAEIMKEVAAARGDYNNLNARFDSKADKATTLAGYGITDTYTKNEVDKELSAKSDLFLQQSASQLIKLTDIDTVINGLQIAIKNNHIKLKGTATANITSWISADVRVETYKSGVTYTGSAQNVIVNGLESGNAQSAIGIRFNYSSNSHLAISGTDNSISFTPESDITGDTAQLSWNILAGEYDKEFDLMLEIGEEKTAFEPYYVVSNIGNHSVTYNKLNEDIQKEINSISGKAESSDLKSKITQFEFIDITTTETGYYYGSFAHNSESNWECTSVPIPCSEGDIFRFSASMTNLDNHQHTVKCYDESKTLIGSYCGVIEEGKNAHYNDKIFVVPEGVSFIAFNCWIAMGNSLKVEKATPIDDLSTQIANGLLENSPSNTLYGKTIYSDGDSIADGAGSNGVSYAHLLRDKYNMTLTDESVGGTTIAVQDGRTDSIYERITSMSGDYDYILFEGGTNDVSLSIDAGTITSGFDEEFDTSTVLGALEGICKFLNTNYFEAQKLFIFVNSRVDDYFWKTKEMFAKMKEVLNKWAIPYVDISSVANLGNWNSTVAGDYFASETDRLHPSLKAYKKFYLPYIEKALLYGGYINT